MTTLAIMKARIADELARSDLTSQIALAISTAIGAYLDEEWHFSESRAAVLTTIVDQPSYTSADLAALSRLEKIHYVVGTFGSTPIELTPKTPLEIELLGNAIVSANDPTAYSWYAETLTLYPTPAAARPVRIAGIFQVAEPAGDDTAGNKWMTDAERLIRCRAKFELYTHIVRNPVMADKMAALANEAEEQLSERYAKKTRTGLDIVEPMAF